MEVSSNQFTPTQGEVINVSRKKKRENLIFGLVVAVIGLGMLFMHWYWLGFIAIFAGLVFSWACGLQGMFSKGRLIIGKDCLQEIEKEALVITHIPYANISEVRFVEFTHNFIGINLQDVNDHGSYCKQKFQCQKDHHGFDHALTDVYTLSPKLVFDKIVSRYEEFTRNEN